MSDPVETGVYTQYFGTRALSWMSDSEATRRQPSPDQRAQRLWLRSISDASYSDLQFATVTALDRSGVSFCNSAATETVALAILEADFSGAQEITSIEKVCQAFVSII